MNQLETDQMFMQQAIALAKLAEEHGEVPVGAVLVKDNQVIATGFNQTISTHDPSAHAEIIALRNAGESIKNYRLINTTLYVTLEPCAMCAMALVHARVERVVFAAADYKTGAAGSVFSLLEDPKHNHKVEVLAGVLHEECSAMLSQFFKKRRAQIKHEKLKQQPKG